MSYTDLIVDFTRSIQFDDFSEKAKAEARMGIFDAAGCAIAGSQQPAGQITAKWARSRQGAPFATVWGHDFKTSTHDAALVNGTAAHALDYDDVSWGLTGHPSVVLNSCLLPLGEELDASGRDILLCYMIGIEIMGKIGLTTQPLHSLEAGWHPTSTIGALGATAACARLLGLSAKEIANALGMMVSMTSGNVINFGTMTKPFHAGVAARNAIEATQLTTLGFTASKSPMDGKRSFHNVYSRGLPAKMEALEELGKIFELDTRGILIKPYPCGVASHPAIDAAQDLYENENVRADDIEKIDIGVTEYTYDKLSYTDVGDELQGKFSISYPVARMFLDGKVRLSNFGGKNIMEPRAQDLIKKTTMYVDEKIERNWESGTNRPCRLIVRLKNGKTFERLVEKSRGDPANPLSREELREKFRDCAGLCFDKPTIEETIQVLEKIDQLKKITILTKLMAGRKSGCSVDSSFSSLGHVQE
jgi:2-methylcitrate dehydratase PrpD